MAFSASNNIFGFLNIPFLWLLKFKHLWFDLLLLLNLAANNVLERYWIIMQFNFRPLNVTVLLHQFLVL
jgi:hypothetical protein